MLFSVEQAFVGRDEKRASLKTPVWEARLPAAVRENKPALIPPKEEESLFGEDQDQTREMAEIEPKQTHNK